MKVGGVGGEMSLLITRSRALAHHARAPLIMKGGTESVRD